MTERPLDPPVPGPSHPGPGGPAGGPPLGSTESRFLSSTVAAWGSQLGRTAIRFLADVALARLVLDEFHGLFDYAFAAVVIAGVLRDAGLPYQLVRDERQPYGTVLAWTGGVGLLLAAALAAGSPLFALLDPRLPAVVAALAPFVLLEGLAVVPRVYFERKLQVGRLVVPELVRGASLAAVAVALATAGFGVWAFVAGELVSMAVYGALLWLRVRGRMPLRFDRRHLPAMLRDSRFLFAIALCAFTLPYLERYIVGPFVTTAMLAQYGKARLWGLRIQTIVVPAVQRVLYPTLVEVQGDEERSFSVYRIGTVTILAFESLAAWFLFFNAETVLVDVLLGEQWRPAVPLLRVICFLPLVDPFNRLGGELLKVRREDRLWLVIVMLNFASLVGFGVWLSSRHGALGLALANFLLLGNLLMAWRVARACGRRFPRLLADLAYVYLAPLAPFGVVVLLFPTEGWGRLAASLAAGLAGAALMALRFQRPFRRFFAGRPDGDGAAPGAPA
ncbi:MAG TPA: oligosaccharide flippase family protein [Thermoanaerobaculia bacterium]|nr:oligosaccharide flippase family protein [Thermoanaerobaculia bacterium]